MDILGKASLETLDTSPVEMLLPQAAVQECPSGSTPSGTLPHSPPLPPSPSPIQELDDFNSCGAHLLSQKLRNLELQPRENETGEVRRSALDPSCLLTPPNTPHILESVDLMTAYQDKWVKGGSETLPWSSDADAHDKGTLQEMHSWQSLFVCSEGKLTAFYLICRWISVRMSGCTESGHEIRFPQHEEIC